MRNKVAVYGLSERVVPTIVAMIQADLPIDFVILENDIFNSAQFSDLLSASQLLSRVSIRLGNFQDVEDADLLMIADQQSDLGPEDYYEQVIPDFRKVINQSMAVGFLGKLFICMPADETFVYLAWKFSGLQKQQIFGIGTYLATLYFQSQLRQRLGVGVHDVRAYVMGTQTKKITFWSRAYVGVSPILGLIPSKMSNFSTTDMDEVETAVQQLADRQESLILLVAVSRVLNAVCCNEAFIAPLMALLTEDKDATVAISYPVLLNADGVSMINALSGSEDENQAVQTVKTVIATVYEKIENTKKG